MDVIHFTVGATDPLEGFDATGVRFLPLAAGDGDSHLSCAHLEPGATIEAPSITHAAAVLVVHGRITITTELGARIDFYAGMGAVFRHDEPYGIEWDMGAILLIVESAVLIPHPRGISSHERIAGQIWPGDAVRASAPTEAL
jgi:hypothetical protein